MILLQSKLEEVNKMAAHCELPDVEISDKGIKISPLDLGEHEKTWGSH